MESCQEENCQGICNTCFEPKLTETMQHQTKSHIPLRFYIDSYNPNRRFVEVAGVYFWVHHHPPDIIKQFEGEDKEIVKRALKFIPPYPLKCGYKWGDQFYNFVDEDENNNN